MPERQMSKDERRDAGRERARQMREKQARKRRRTRVLLVCSVAVVIALVAGATALVVTRAGERAAAASATPAGVSADGGIITGAESAAHTVTIYQDYQCPYCKAFESTLGPWLQEQRDAGVTKIEYRPIAFLDTAVNQDYSTRSANAAFCAAGVSGADYSAFNDALYAAQPEEGTAGLTDSRLIGIAEEAGIEGIGTCVSGGDHEAYVKARTTNALEAADKGGAGITGTPTVLVDGTVVKSAQGGIPGKTDLAAALGVTG